jgi:hypothetical protein
MLGVQLAQVYCAQLFKCCSQADLPYVEGALAGSVTDEASCRLVYGGLVAALIVSEIQSGQASGHLVYHGDLLGQCLSSFAGLSCSDFAAAMNGGGPLMAGNAPACMSFIEPKVAAGGACGSAVECIGGLDCVHATGTGTGTCQVKAKLKLGDACNANPIGCDTGLYCPITTGTCTMLAANGVMCNFSNECQSGHCGIAMGMATCQPPLADGQTCQSDSDCVNGNCTGSGVSGTCAAKLADRQPCHASSECMSGSCAEMSRTGMHSCAPSNLCQGH